MDGFLCSIGCLVTSTHSKDLQQVPRDKLSLSKQPVSHYWKLVSYQVHNTTVSNIEWLVVLCRPTHWVLPVTHPRLLLWSTVAIRPDTLCGVRPCSSCKLFVRYRYNMHSPIWRRSVYKVLAKWYSVTWQDEVIYLVPCLYIVVYTHLSLYMQHGYSTICSCCLHGNSCLHKVQILCWAHPNCGIYIVAIPGKRN